MWYPCLSTDVLAPILSICILLLNCYLCFIAGLLLVVKQPTLRHLWKTAVSCDFLLISIILIALVLLFCLLSLFFLFLILFMFLFFCTYLHILVMAYYLWLSLNVSIFLFMRACGGDAGNNLLIYTFCVTLPIEVKEFLNPNGRVIFFFNFNFI